MLSSINRVATSSRLRPASQLRHPCFTTQRFITTRPVARAAGTSADSVTLFAGGFDFDVEEEDVKQLFAPFGVTETRMARKGTRGERVFRGHAFVSIADGGADAAIEALNGTEVHGRTIRVEKRRHVSRPRQQRAGDAANIPADDVPADDSRPRRVAVDAAADISSDEVPADEGAGAPATAQTAGVTRLYVGNLNINSIKTKEDVKQLFEPYGRVTRVVMGMTPKLKNQCAWVTVPAAGADDAIAQLNGSEYDGRTINVELAKLPTRSSP